MGEDERLAAQTVEAVRNASDLEGALEALVAHLRPRFDLWTASFCSHPTGAQGVTILASWSVADTVFDAGTEISATISKTVIEVLETLRDGHGATFVVGADRESLVDHLLREQGVACVLALPIHSDERGLLLMALGASSEGAFRNAEKGFFSTLSQGISDAVLRLAAAPNA